MGTLDGLRIVSTLVGGGFLVYVAIAAFRGTVYDTDDGHIDRDSRPLTFWLTVASMAVLGVVILGVGWQWPVMGAVSRAIGPW